MRAVHLRSSAIGSYARPITEAPRAIFVLALVSAAGVALPWAEGLGWSKRGWWYEQGLITLGAAVVSVYLSAARADGKIGRTWFEALALACALVGLCSTLWFYFDVVGSTDNGPIARSMFGFPPPVAGATGLYVSMAGFLAQIAVLAWHASFVVQLRMRTALRSPWTAAALVVVAAAGVLLPWNHSWPTPDRGWSTGEGLVALVSATTAAIICGLRLSGRIRRLPYALLGLLWAAVGLAAVAWFHAYAVWAIERGGYPLLVWWLNAPRSGAGLHESISAAGFIGALAVFAWQLWQARRSNI